MLFLLTQTVSIFFSGSKAPICDKLCSGPVPIIEKGMIKNQGFTRRQDVGERQSARLKCRLILFNEGAEQTHALQLSFEYPCDPTVPDAVPYGNCEFDLFEPPMEGFPVVELLPVSYSPADSLLQTDSRIGGSPVTGFM